MRVTCKGHLHGAEGTLFEPEKARAFFDVGGWRVAVAICFDAAHPRHAEAAAAEGADLYFLSALYVVGDEPRARAAPGRASHGLLVLGARQPRGHVRRPRIVRWERRVAPDRRPLCRASSAGETLLVAELDPPELATFRIG